jgi:hypothetical protein
MMVRAIGTFAVVSAGLLGFWAGYRLDARWNLPLPGTGAEQDQRRTQVAA